MNVDRSTGLKKYGLEYRSSTISILKDFEGTCESHFNYCDFCTRTPPKRKLKKRNNSMLKPLEFEKKPSGWFWPMKPMGAKMKLASSQQPGQ